jgi:hypothetical protein
VTHPYPAIGEHDRYLLADRDGKASTFCMWLFKTSWTTSINHVGSSKITRRNDFSKNGGLQALHDDNCHLKFNWSIVVLS